MPLHPESTGRFWNGTNLGLALLLHIILTAFLGYRFGDQDMTETLSYALYLRDISLYPKDLYIQAVGTSWLNERLPFTLILYPFTNNLEWACFIIHLVSSLLFLLGLIRIARRYLATELWVVLFTLTSILLLYHINLGGNEAWYNYFVPSQAAKCIAIWSIVYFLEQKYDRAFLVLIPATLMQPVVGIQLVLLFTCVLGWSKFINPARENIPWKGLAVYMLTAGLWLATVFIHHLITDSSVTSRQFYDIMESRLAHHFFPSYYPITSWVLLIPLFILAATIWRKIEYRLHVLFAFSLVGMAMYVFLIEVLELSYFLSVQWFKITVWLKPLSILAVFAWSEKRVKIPRIKLVTALAISALLFVSLAELGGWVNLVKGKPYFFPFTNYYTDEMTIALEARERLDPEACLLIPPTVTGMRFFSKRSLFIDYKSNIHSKEYMAESYRRRQALYGMDLDLRKAGKNMVFVGNDYYHNLSAEEFQMFRSDGATHVMVSAGKKLNLTLILQTSVFAIYEL